MAILRSKVHCVIGTTLKSLDITNPDKLIWSDCNEFLNDGQKAGIAVLNNAIYTIGGLHNNEELATGEMFDLVLGKAESKADISDARSRMGLVALNGRVYAVGGFKTISNSITYCNFVDCFEPVTNSWASMLMISIPRKSSKDRSQHMIRNATDRQAFANVAANLL